MVKGNNQRGVGSVSEYVVTFFLVVAVVVAMTTYVQRGIQARMYDARQHVIKTVSDNCDSNCMAATGLAGKSRVGSQYEPYYMNASSDTISDSRNQKGLLAPGIGSTGIFIEASDAKNKSSSDSNQMPPMAAAQDTVLGAQ